MTKVRIKAGQGMARTRQAGAALRHAGFAPKWKRRGYAFHRVWVKP